MTVSNVKLLYEDCQSDFLITVRIYVQTQMGDEL